MLVSDDNRKSSQKYQKVSVLISVDDRKYPQNFRYQIFSIPVLRLFPVPNFSDIGSETFFRYQIFPIPVPRLFSGTNFFRYRFRYHQKYEKFPIPGIPGTGTLNSGPYAICPHHLSNSISKLRGTKRQRRRAWPTSCQGGAASGTFGQVCNTLLVCF